MGNAQHTPGPYRVHDHQDKRHHEYAIMSETGNQHDGGAVKVASVLGSKNGHVSMEQALINANLFAAAPELLEMLSRVCAVQAEHYGHATDFHIAMIDVAKEARAAIAKATGSKEASDDRR